ncbi:Thylakoid membrane protein TERC, chloroplastic, partial [Linum grandiflorum]
SEAEKIGSERHDDAVESLDKTEGDKSYATSVKTVVLCVSSAVAFGIGIGLKEGVGKASEFFAGYLLEQSLSVDNLFVFVLIFNYFKVPLMYQNRVLSYGIAGAIIFRLSLILLGTVTLQRFEAVNLLLAGILLYSSFKLLFVSEEDDTDLSDNFIVKTCQRFIPVTCNFLVEAVWSCFLFFHFIRSLGYLNPQRTPQKAKVTHKRSLYPCVSNSAVVLVLLLASVWGSYAGASTLGS